MPLPAPCTLAYPPPPSLLQMVAVMLTGNGVAWQLFCSLWGSLPFR
jgi:hypothetical protein